jgi:hypothetical protein
MPVLEIWDTSECHSVQDDAEGKDIDLRGALLVEVQFWRHIQWGAFRRQICIDADLLRLQELCQSKIRNLKRSIIQHNIFWLDIPVNDASLHQNPITRTELDEKVLDVLLSQQVFVGLHIPLEISRVAVLHNQIEVVLA